MTDPTRNLPAIAFLTSRYPALSETFVWREVLAMSERGWSVVSVSMHAPDPEDLRIGDLPANDVLLREHGIRTLLIDAVAETLHHPLRSLRTLGLVSLDSLNPGETTRMGQRLRNLIHAISGLATARRLRPLKVAHIHCHFAHAPTGVGMYAATQLGVGFSFVGHANDLFANRLLLRRKLERAAFVSCISEWHRDWYREQAPQIETSLPIVRCGVRVDETAPTRDRSDGNGRLRLISVARLVPKKGLDLLIPALAQAGEKNALDWELRIAGEGPERKALTDLAMRSGVAERVSFLGAVGPSRVQSLLVDSDLFVLPCRVDKEGDRDGIPVALMEAMAVGLPVVAGDLPTLRELIIHGENGILCDVEDRDGLAQTLATLAHDPDRRREFGERARQHVIREFALEENARRLDAALCESLGLGIRSQ